MRRQAIVLIAIGVAVFGDSGVVLAEIVSCNTTPPCYGTPEDDQITGTAAGETIQALAGSDRVFWSAGDDTIYGGAGNDSELDGGQGSDTVYGGRGSDEIGLAINEAANTTDRAFGGGGNDEIFAADGFVDIIDCGKGNDTVVYDASLDTVKGCEQ